MKKVISFEKEIGFSSMIGEVTSIALDHTLKFIDSSSIKGNFVISGTYKMTEASTLEEKFSYDVPTEIDLSERLELETCKISIDDFTYEIVNEDTLKCNIDVLIEGVEDVLLDEEESIEVLNNDDDDDRECDGDKKEDKEIEIPIKEEVKSVDVDVDAIVNNGEDVVTTVKEDINKIDIPIREESSTLENQDVKEANIEKVEEVMAINNKVEKENDQGKVKNKSDAADIGSLFASLDSADETFTTYSVYIFRREDTLDQVLSKYKITREALCEYNDLDNLEIGSKLIIPNTNE